MRLDHLLSKEYMPLDCSRDRNGVQTKSTTDILYESREVARAKESIDHLDRMAGGTRVCIKPALFSLEGTNLVRFFKVISPYALDWLSPSSAADRRGASPPKFTMVNEAASNEVGDGEILENCIEKNFHVSQIHMRAAILLVGSE